MIAETFKNEDLTLYRGECIEVMRTLPDSCVDAAITDPPYSSGGQYRGDRMSLTSAKYVGTDTQLERPEFQGDNRDQRAYAYWSQLWMYQAYRVTKPGGVLCVFTDWRQLAQTIDAIQAAGWVYRGIVVWDKTQAVRPVKGRFRSQAEYVVWGSHGGMVDRDGPVLPGVYTMSVHGNGHEKAHIAAKPPELMQALCRIAWREDAVVLDPFMGSGTTGVAALACGHKFVGVEIDPVWYKHARERLAAETKQGRLFVGTQREFFDDSRDLRDAACG